MKYGTISTKQHFVLKCFLSRDLYFMLHVPCSTTYPSSAADPRELPRASTHRGNGCGPFSSQRTSAGRVSSPKPLRIGLARLKFPEPTWRKRLRTTCAHMPAISWRSEERRG